MTEEEVIEYEKNKKHSAKKTYSCYLLCFKNYNIRPPHEKWKQTLIKALFSAEEESQEETWTSDTSL